MKLRITCFACLSLFGFVAETAAQTCPSGARVSGGNALQTLLTNRTVCASRSGETWQEFHSSASGALIDYKRGSNPIDPTKQVGTWSASNGSNAAVTYDYGPGSVYTFIVCAVPNATSPTSYTFVGPSTITGATLKPAPPATATTAQSCP